MFFFPPLSKNWSSISERYGNNDCLLQYKIPLNQEKNNTASLPESENIIFIQGFIAVLYIVVVRLYYIIKIRIRVSIINIAHKLISQIYRFKRICLCSFNFKLRVSPVSPYIFTYNIVNNSKSVQMVEIITVLEL